MGHTKKKLKNWFETTDTWEQFKKRKA
jgi:hypothetical protein